MTAHPARHAILRGTCRPTACPLALQEVGASISSALAGAKVEAEQACYLPVAADSVPVIGKVPGVQGCYMASGETSLSLHNYTLV